MNYRLKLLVALAVVAGTLPWVILGFRASQSSRKFEQQDRLCLIFYGLVQNQLASIGTHLAPGYAYYQEHPGELRIARAASEQTLKELPCKPETPKS